MENRKPIPAISQGNHNPSKETKIKDQLEGGDEERRGEDLGGKPVDLGSGLGIWRLALPFEVEMGI